MHTNGKSRKPAADPPRAHRRGPAPRRRDRSGLAAPGGVRGQPGQTPRGEDRARAATPASPRSRRSCGGWSSTLETLGEPRASASSRWSTPRWRSRGRSRGAGRPQRRAAAARPSATIPPTTRRRRQRRAGERRRSAPAPVAPRTAPRPAHRRAAPGAGRRLDRAHRPDREWLLMRRYVEAEKALGVLAPRREPIRDDPRATPRRRSRARRRGRRRSRRRPGGASRTGAGGAHQGAPERPQRVHREVPRERDTAHGGRHSRARRPRSGSAG